MPALTDIHDPKAEVTPKTKKRRVLRRGVVLRALAIAFVLLVGMWIAVHRIPWFGSAVADGLRAVVGTENVAKIEDFVYGFEDRWNQFWRSDEKPKAYWQVPEEEAPVAEAVKVEPSPDAGPAAAKLSAFKPPNVGPVFDHMAAEGDGIWVPVADPAKGEAPIVMHKTLLHPDRKRPWAELFVVALDLRQVELQFVLGTVEPKATDPSGRGIDRPGLIPSAAHDALLAAFNGGFKLEHGRWGAAIGEATVVAPSPYGCTVAATSSGKIVIDRWPDLEPTRDSLAWWRQTPPCMFHDGARHGALWDPDAKGWGATLEGDTVIRRSAIGLDPGRSILFVGMSNHTAAHALADGMHHAGAADVAQLDVNWSYPRFTIFPIEEGIQKTKTLFEGFEVDEDDYLREPQSRDFFYVVRKPAAAPK